MAAVFAGVLPSRDEIDEESRTSGSKVTGMRRFWASLFDYVCISLLSIFLLGAVRILYPEFTGYSIYGEVYSWSFFCMVSLVQVLITKGLTLGHASCRMILVAENGETASAGQLIKRYLCLWMFTEMPLIAAGLLMNVRFAFVIDLVILGLTAASRVYFLMYFIDMVFRKGKLMPHDKLSGTLYTVICTAKKEEL